MGKFIEEFYYGNIDPQARSTKQNQTVQKQMAEREGVTEQLKADNQKEWVDQMNNIRGRATEMVNTDLIYGWWKAVVIWTLPPFSYDSFL